MREQFKVKSESKPNSIAGAIASALKQGNIVELQSIGACAVNQAVKAVIIANGFLSPQGMQCCCVPSFLDVDIEGERKTGIKFTIAGKYV